MRPFFGNLLRDVLLAAKLGAPIDRGVRAIEAVGCEGYRFLVTSAAGLEVVQVAT